MEKEYFVLYTPESMYRAYNLLNKSYSKTAAYELLLNGDDIEKQAALINISCVESCRDAEILISVLTGQHGPIREICSAKVNQFLKNENNRDFFCGKIIREICLNALNDIIPTVARNILEVLKFLPDIDIVCGCLMDRILDLKNYSDNNSLLNNHEITKKTFKLYWYLETLATFPNNILNQDKMEEIIKYTYNHEDYTIREKVAKILSKSAGFDNYKKILKDDKNPYVFFYLK